MATHERRGGTQRGQRVQGLASSRQRGIDGGHFWDTVEGKYLVELDLADDGTLTRVSVSRTDGRAVSTRDVRRLPLARLLDLASVYHQHPDFDPKQRLRATAKRPDDKKGGYYQWLAQTYLTAKARGKSPAQEIARLTGQEVNTVYHQVWRARHKHHLDF